MLKITSRLLTTMGMVLSLSFSFACQKGPKTPEDLIVPTVIEKKKGPITHQVACACMCSKPGGNENQVLDEPLGGCGTLNDVKCGKDAAGQLRNCSKVSVPVEAKAQAGIDGVIGNDPNP